MTDTTDPMSAFDSLLKWVRRIAIAGVAMFIAAALAIVAVRQESNDRSAEIQQSRAEARAGACAQDNVRIDQHNLLVDAGTAIQVEIDSIIAFSTSVPDGAVLPPAQQARLDQLRSLAADSKANVDKALGDSVVVRRDCTPAGIDTYYAKQGS